MHSSTVESVDRRTKDIVVMESVWIVAFASCGSDDLFVASRGYEGFLIAFTVGRWRHDSCAKVFFKVQLGSPMRRIELTKFGSVSRDMPLDQNDHSNLEANTDSQA
ncbi:hypothetical protein TNCV_3674041 [Trichonephila clavipes]|nr:hypothetical protein TNCV_3674041 [Trichonephila clavipes]